MKNLLNTMMKIVNYKNYLFCYIAIVISTYLAYFKLRPLMLEDGGLTRVYISLFTLNVATVFFLALFYWQKWCPEWFKMKNSNQQQIVEISGAIVIIAFFYGFLKFESMLK